MTQTIPELNLLSMSAESLLSHVSGLPAWDRSLDDDPHWLAPTTAAGFRIDRRPVKVDDATMNDIWHGRRPPVQVPVAQVRVTGQGLVRLDAVAHYLKVSHDQLYDPEPWWGTDHPLLLELDGEYRVMDGVSRTTAARVRGDQTLTAYVVAPHEWRHVAA